MKKVYLFVVVVTVTFALLQSAEARGGSRSFGSAPHFSAPTFHSAPARSFSSGSARFSGRAHFSAPATFHNRSYTAMGPRFSGTTAARNAAYLTNRARFSGNRAAAFNSYSRSSARLAAGNRTFTNRSSGFNRGRVLSRRSANWQRHWDRGRDHSWRGHRCHFHNGFWFIYDPWPFYPYGYGYGSYPYGSYYDASYYDDGTYAADEYAQAPDATQSQSDAGSQVSDVQSALAREGYYDGAIDGSLGPATRKALRRYQRDRGLQATGDIDRATINALRLR